MSDHHLTVTISPEDGPHLEITCTADPDAPCHQVHTCDDPLCDDGGGCPSDAVKLIDYCNPLEWITNYGGPVELFAGPIDTPLRSGPVELLWDGEFYVWDYAPSKYTVTFYDTEVACNRCHATGWVSDGDHGAQEWWDEHQCPEASDE